MATDPSITPNAGPSEGLGSHQEPAGGSNGAREVPDAARPAEARTGPSAAEDAANPPSFAWLCLTVRNCPDAGRELYATAEEAQQAQDLHDAEVHGQEPPAARLSAEERPEAAGEPESGEDGAAGREAALDRSRRYLVPVARLDLPDLPAGPHLAIYQWEPRVEAWVTGPALCGYPVDQGALPVGTKVGCAECLEQQPQFEWRFDCDGCHRACLHAGEHTLRWGFCEHAVPSEPTVSVNRAFTAADGQRSIGFDRFTTAELAELIEPALREVGIRLGPNALTLLQDGHEVRLSAAEITRLALAAADAIVTHSNRDAT